MRVLIDGKPFITRTGTLLTVNEWEKATTYQNAETKSPTDVEIEDGDMRYLFWAVPPDKVNGRYPDDRYSLILGFWSELAGGLENGYIHVDVDVKVPRGDLKYYISRSAEFWPRDIVARFLFTAAITLKTLGKYSSTSPVMALTCASTGDELLEELPDDLVYGAEVVGLPNMLGGF